MRWLALLSLVMCGACGSSPQASPTPASVGTDSSLPTDAPAATDAEAPAETDPPTFTGIDLTLVDQNDANPAGIPVDVSGHGLVASDSEGRVRVELDPGDYGVQVVAGCHEQVRVAGGGSAQLGVAQGQTTTGHLVVTWQHRFGPAPPVFSSQNEDFPVGQDVTLTFAVRDRCDDEEEPGAAFETFEVVLSEAMASSGQPQLRSDDEGRSSVTVRCTQPGEASIVLRDRANPSDQIDLVDHLSGFGGRPVCS